MVPGSSRIARCRLLRVFFLLPLGVRALLARLPRHCVGCGWALCQLPVLFGMWNAIETTMRKTFAAAVVG